jgi:hypothetical protein
MTTTSKIPIPRKTIKGQFATLEEAIAFKNKELLGIFQNSTSKIVPQK